tara:strand:- start:67 stop:1020 length:954 start_codon:yes stop_codon:yes gene_type:complete
MRKSKLSLCVLLSTSFASAQVTTSAQLVGGQVLAGVSASAAIVPGTDAWSGLSRAANSGANASSLALAHQLGTVDIELQWQLSTQAITNGNSVSHAEVRYELVSPILQTGELLIDWQPASTGTGQATVAIDVYDDGYVDTQTSAAIPVVFGTGQYPLILRVTAEASAQAGSMQGPWGTSWSWNGTASGQLRIRFVPRHATATTLTPQTCAPVPALTSQPDLHEGVRLAGLCAPTDHFALFALGFQAADQPLPLSTNCRLLITPVVALVHALQPGTAIHQSIPVPPAARPVHFLAQLIALNATTMTLTASNLLQTNIQ